MEVIKSSRFWLALIALAVIGALALLGKLSGEGAAGYLMSILAGFGVAKASGGSAPKALLPFALVAVASLSACGTTGRGYLAKGLDLAATADKAILPTVEKICVAAVAKCGQVPPEKCAAFTRCHAALVGYQAAMNSVTKGLAEANRALELLGVP